MNYLLTIILHQFLLWHQDIAYRYNQEFDNFLILEEKWSHQIDYEPGPYDDIFYNSRFKEHLTFI